MKPWHLYLLECRDGSLYAGVTTDLANRFSAHANGTGAKYTRANPPVRFAATAAFPDRSSVSRAEWQIKQLPRSKKIAWLMSAGAVAAAEVIGVPLESWADNPALVVCKLAESGLYDGRIRVGTYLGPSAACSTGERPGVSHAWIKTTDNQIIDPTRWLLEGAAPCITTVPADSTDYQEKDAHHA
ncbi:GIY-YIG nuclease family protein [Geopseudomonas aromaticivorans]